MSHKAMLERMEKDEKARDVAEVKWPFKRILNGHLIIRIDTFHQTGRIIVPDAAKRKSTLGYVVAKADDITDIQVGDKILYSQYAGYLLKFADTPLCRCIGYTEVLGVMNEDSPELESESA